MYTNPVFAPIDLDHSLKRVAGGNETEVYLSDDGHHVIKFKAATGGSLAQAQAAARAMSHAAEQFAACLGPRYSIPSQYIISSDPEGHARILVIQPYIVGALPLHDLDYNALGSDERISIGRQLREIIDRSLRFYRSTGTMPDLYGRTSSSVAERARNRSLSVLPYRLWSFLVERNLLRSHNLMYTSEGQVVLVDYDPVQRSQLYRTVYYNVRWMLFWRDHVLIQAMHKNSGLPKR